MAMLLVKKELNLNEVNAEIVLVNWTAMEVEKSELFQFIEEKTTESYDRLWKAFSCGCL